MTVKYKVSDFAKDLSISAKKVLDELNAMGSTGKKNSSTLEENELNYLLEKFSKDNSVKSLDEFLNSAKAPKAEPKPAEKKAEPKAEKKPEAPKAEPAKAEAKPAAKQNNKKNEQHKKREEKTVSLSELARETGAKATAASAQSVSVRREDNQVTVDTRTVDMNVDRFDARYDDLASTKNTENRRKPTPQGNKQKFTQRGQRQRQQFQKGKRETEFERLQRIQLEKARNAQLKVMIPDEITVGELAARLKQQAGKVIAKFMQMGEMHAINDVIDFDTASLLAEEFHAKVEHEVHVTIEERLFTQEEDSAEDLVERPPVVCVMGDAIMELQQEISFDFEADCVGEKLLVMIEGYLPDEHAYVGRTYMDAPGIDGYIFIKSGEALMSGDFAEAVVTGSDEYDLIGELYEEHESAE